jgi:hypothetical protein
MNSDSFIGEWELAPSGNEMITDKINYTITKENQLYIVNWNIVRDGKTIEMSKLMSTDSTSDPMTKQLFKDMLKYQLSPDKRFLINIINPTTDIIEFKEEEKLIIARNSIMGSVWLKRK